METERNADKEKYEKYKKESDTSDLSCHFGLTLRIVVGFFFMLCLAAVLSFGLIMLLHRLGILHTGVSFLQPLLLFSFISVIVGSLLSVIFSRKVLAPIREAIDAANELARGNFEVKTEMKGAWEIRELGRSFNHMAEELGSLEMLRSDFVNNFSHEFKTPIASIRGFARMLQREDLTQEERAEYLEIIVSESERLTELSTNVLNLSRIENQTILSNQTVYNCSEQIRKIIVLLEPKWSKKQ